MLQGVYTELKINDKQRTYCEQHAGTARHAWNWGLETCLNNLRAHERIPSAIDLHKLLVKNVKSANPWYYEVSKWSPQQALRDLENAFKKFWKQEHPKNLKKPYRERFQKKFLKQHSKGEIEQLGFEHEKGFPQFKKKNVNDKFYLEGKISVGLNKIKVPKFGELRTYEKMWAAENSAVKNVTISRRADRWFISFKMEKEITEPENRKRKIGVDVGIKTLATLSDGKKFENPKAYNKQKKKLARLQRKLSRQYEAGKENRDDKGRIIYGANYKKTKNKIAVLHLKISNVRKDSTHKLTSYLVKSHDRIVIEDLNVGGMMKNHNLAAAIADGGFYEFRRQLTYKSEWYKCELVIADRWFASSKICSCCGHKKEKLSLRERIFNCEKCGLKIDRDLNAAINLEKFDAVSDTVKVFGSGAKVQRENVVSVLEGETGHQAPVLTDGQVWVSS